MGLPDHGARRLFTGYEGRTTGSVCDSVAGARSRPAGVSDEIVHEMDLCSRRLRRIAGGEGPDGIDLIDGIDMSDFLLGKTRRIRSRWLRCLHGERCFRREVA